MDLEAYISSGILELYVAGSLSDQESREVTSLIEQHPELKEAVEAIEIAFIQFAETAAPSGDVPPLSISGLKSEKSESKPTQVIGLPVWQRYAMAAVIVLLIGSVLLNLLQYSKIQDANGQLAELETERQRIAGDFDRLNANFSDQRNRFNDLRDPNTTTIALAGTDKAPDKTVQVYWNQESDRVFVDISQLPEPPEGKEYQLWSLTSLDPLTPVDAGVLSDYALNEDKVFDGKDTDQAVAFAITLEPAGGSVAPTLDELYVLGTI